VTLCEAEFTFTLFRSQSGSVNVTAMQIYVDADALPSPIKDVLLRAAERVRIHITFIANQVLRVPKSDYIESIEVPDGPDIADDKIVEWVRLGDLVITADIPLADRVIEKDALALDPRGEMYTASNIKERLATRNLLNELRNDGSISMTGGGPPPFHKKNVHQFASQLERCLAKNT
jgi:uncharacterized protein YaiI (UPF0178 family)